MKISIIITTYNRPDALALVLNALAQQSDQDFEVLIADDGSHASTKELIESTDFSVSLKHVWQADEGFRAAKIRNKAVAQSSGDYLVFLDGDCIPLPQFVQKHRDLSERGYFVAGNRTLLSQPFTEKILAESVAIHRFSLLQFVWAKYCGRINRYLPVISLPLGPLRKLKADDWRGVKTCNLGLWKQDFLAVNGFDEEYVGWGFEDSDLVIRLLRNNIRRKLGRFAAPVMHLWHPENDRSFVDNNLNRLQSIEKNETIWAASGVDQHLVNASIP